MKFRNSAASLALAVVAVLGVAGPAAAGDQVPFHGRFEGDLTRTPIDQRFFLDEFDTAGNATRLGRFELLITATVDPVTRTATGTFEFVAANGDRLVADFVGRSQPTGTPGVILLTEVAVIDPDLSTGRFAGATGGFTSERLFDLVNFTTVGSFEGTISSRGARKR